MKLLSEPKQLAATVNKKEIFPRFGFYFANHRNCMFEFEKKQKIMEKNNQTKNEVKKRDHCSAYSNKKTI